ncbi:MAG: mechanosensitive ion channel family protein [Gemmatimonadota bacterium]|nr:mechanosensitive ion channel family protein [Gemmatimonadota bacterium]
MLPLHSRPLAIALCAIALGAHSSVASVQGNVTNARDSVAAPAPHIDSLPGSPVVLGVDTLFRLYGALGPFTPAQRASAVAARLADAANAHETFDSVAVIEQNGFSELVMRGVVLMTVVDSDAAPLARARDLVARTYAARIQQALAQDRERLSARALLIDVGYAAAASLVLLLALFLLHLAFPRLYRRIEAVRRARVPALRIQQLELLSAEGLSRALLMIAQGLRVAVTIVLLYIYIPLVLGFFPWTEPLSRRIVGYALTPLGVAWEAFVGFVPSIFYLLVIVLITRYVLKLIHALFRAIESGAVTFDGFYREWADPTYKIARVLVLAFAVVASFPYLPGSHTDAFKGVSLFLGVLFSLGSSSAVSNIVAGIVLTYTRAFEVGDRVQIGEAIGDVTERSLLVTRVRTIKNVEVTIPNGTVLAAQVRNYTRLAQGAGLVLHTTVTIGYDAPWRTVHELLIAAALRTEYIMDEPAPYVLQTSLDDFYVSYEVNALTRRPELMATTYSALHRNIQDSFNEAGVEIMSPHYGALRDGNDIAIPTNYRTPGDAAPGFRVALGRRRAAGGEATNNG